MEEEFERLLLDYDRAYSLRWASLPAFGDAPVRYTRGTVNLLSLWTSMGT
jgi:hypothetical protein